MSAPPTPDERDQWIAKLREDHHTASALVRVEMAADALRKAYDADAKTNYAAMMALVDKHLIAAREADRSEVFEILRDLRKQRDKGDGQVSRFQRIGRKPRPIEAAN